MKIRQAKKIVCNLLTRRSAYTEKQISDAFRRWRPNNFFLKSTEEYVKINEWILKLAKSGRYPHLTDTLASFDANV